MYSLLIWVGRKSVNEKIFFNATFVKTDKAKNVLTLINETILQFVLQTHSTQHNLNSVFQGNSVTHFFVCIFINPVYC